MATLTIPHSFTAGTPALASEVNANFQAIVNWTNSNIGTDNFGILTARSVALPSSPTFAILSLSQSASQPVISISNQGTDNPISINQSGVFATGKGAIVINDPTAQTTSGVAHLLMSLSSASTVPAIKVNHGSDVTMSLTKTQLDLFNSVVQATSTGAINSVDTLTITSPAASAVALKLKGRGSDNNAVLQFKSNDDANEQARLTSQPSKLIADIPTGSQYEFKINNVDKVIIDNDGIDGQYLTDASINRYTKLNTPNIVTVTGSTYSQSNAFSFTDIGFTASIVSSGRPYLVFLRSPQWYISNAGSGFSYNYIGQLRIKKNGVVIETYTTEITAERVNASPPSLEKSHPFSTTLLFTDVAGTYTFTLEAAMSGQTANTQYILETPTMILIEL